MPTPTTCPPKPGPVAMEPVVEGGRLWLRLYRRDGSEVVPPGSEVRCQARRRESPHSLVFDAEGHIEVTADGTEVVIDAPLEAGGDATPPGRYDIDVLYYDADGSAWRVMYGALQVDRTATQKAVSP